VGFEDLTYSVYEGQEEANVCITSNSRRDFQINISTYALPGINESETQITKSLK